MVNKLLIALAIFSLILVKGQATIATAGTWPFVGGAAATPTPVPSNAPPPVVMPFAIDGFSPAPAPDATACANLYFQVRDNTESAATPSPYPCPAGVVAKYVDATILTCTSPPTCNTQVQDAIYTYATGTNTNAFAYAYNHPLQAAYQYVSGSKYYMDIGNPAYDAWLNSNIWTNTGQHDFPIVAGQQIGVWSDTMETDGSTAVGGNPPFTQYGSGDSPTGFATLPGSGTYSVGFSWEVAQAHLINSVPANMTVTINGLGPATSDISGCSDISAGSCHDPFFTDFINDQFDVSVLCASLTRPLTAIFSERSLEHYASGTANPGSLADATTIVGMVDTIAGLVQHTTDNCANTKLVDGEFPVDSDGTIAGGYPIRTLSTAYRWLVPNPVTNNPDRVVAGDSPIGGLDVSNEVPAFFEELLVPYSAEIAVGPFVWNGSRQSIGANCENVGDRGGAVPLTVQCVGADPIMVQQYKACYLNTVNLGPCAAILNSSTTTENIVSGWFARGGSDPISSYHHILSLSGGELTAVPYSGVGTISLSCTNGTNCTGSSSLSGQEAAFAGNGSDQISGQSGVILLQ